MFFFDPEQVDVFTAWPPGGFIILLYLPLFLSPFTLSWFEYHDKLTGGILLCSKLHNNILRVKIL